MSQQIISSQFQRYPAMSFRGILAAGTMIATLLVVAYACLVSPEGAVRVQIVLQGAEVILLTLAAGIIAGGLHAVSVASESIRAKTRFAFLRETGTV